MTYSLVITSDSAWVIRLQLCPALSSALLIRMKPEPSSFVSMTPGALPEPYSVSQLAPWVMTSRWLNCGCGDHGCHFLPGCHRAAIAYWSRSMYPVSWRTMKGTVTPSVVVVVATSAEGGGFLGSYGWNEPADATPVTPTLPSLVPAGT